MGVPVFNAMTPAQLTALLASLLSESASWTRPLDGFQVGQLKSASSIGRHLTAELGGAPAAAARFAEDLTRALDEETVGAPEAAALRTAIGGMNGTFSAGDAANVPFTAPTPAALGGAIAELLAAARADPGAAPLVARVRGLLRDLADTEISILSGPPRGAA
jgi:hypothetical protein